MPDAFHTLTREDVTQLDSILRAYAYASDDATLNKRSLKYRDRFNRLLLPPAKRTAPPAPIRSAWPSGDVAPTQRNDNSYDPTNKLRPARKPRSSGPSVDDLLANISGE